MNLILNPRVFTLQICQDRLAVELNCLKARAKTLCLVLGTDPQDPGWVSAGEACESEAGRDALLLMDPAIMSDAQAKAWFPPAAGTSIAVLNYDQTLAQGLKDNVLPQVVDQAMAGVELGA